MNYYDKINWKNRSEERTTKISAERLNHMDNQIFDNANAIGNVEKIADIGDGTLCGAAESLRKTADKLNQSLANIQSHVGMIIQTTTLDTEAKVKAIYGGNKWSKIEGRFLLGASSAYKVNSMGGAATHNISVREMPSHAHSVNAVNTGGNNVGHTHSIPSLSGSTSSAGNHNHYTFNYGGNGYWYGSDWGNGTSFSCASSPTTQDKPTTSTNGAHTHSVTTNASTTGGQSANHVHTVPAHNTNANGSGSAMSIMPPYKAVYIWERIA